MFARCDLSGIWNIYYFVAYLRMFSGGELWATVQMSKFVTCSTCDKLRHWERPESCIAFASTLIWLMPSAVNPTIDPLPDRAVHNFSDTSMSLARFLFLRISHFFMCLGDYSPCVRKLWIVGSLTRPARNDSERWCPEAASLGANIAWHERSGVNLVKSRRCRSHSPTKTGNCPQS